MLGFHFVIGSAQLLNYVIAYFSLGFVLLLLAGFVYFQKKSNPVNRIFAAYSLAIAWWSLFTIPMIAGGDARMALFWDQVCLSGAIFIPTTFFHFVMVFLRLSEKHRRLVHAAYGVSFLFLIANFTPYFVRGVEPVKSFNYYTVPALLYHFFVGYFSFLSTASILFLFREMRKKKTRDLRFAKQVKWLFLTSLVGYLGGGTNFMTVYGVFIPYVSAAANYAVLIYGLAMAYIILRYQFLNIEVIVRKTLVFAGLFAFVFGVFSFVLFVGQELLAVYFGFKWEVALAVSILLIVIGYEPMREFLINTTDRYLFQKKYDYQQLLKDAARGMSRIENLNHLLGLVIHFITMRMRVANAAILTRKNVQTEFQLEYQRGYDKNFLEYYLGAQDPLIQYLACEKEPVIIEQMEQYINAGNRKEVKGEVPRVYDFEGILKAMKNLEATCCIPSFLGRELKNILVLGEKKSGEDYSQQDLNVLFTIAQESAIAIENARLYDEAINKTRELEQINAQLEYAKNLLMKALKETEVANKQLQDTQAQLIHEQKMATLGRLAASVGHEVNNPLTILSMNVSRVLLKLRKNPDLKVQEIMDTFGKMEQNIGRIKAVVNTLTGLLKKSEKGKFEPLSLKLVLEETLPLIQFQTYLDNLTGTEVEFNVPANLPLVRGDLERLQEVFLNLFINAYHAMEGRPNRRIYVRAYIEAENTEMVAIHFTDNGKGMTEEVQKKIFNYGYTTKAPGRGSGLGLYMCKYIIELHGGDIRVQSEVDKGTEFIIRLPVARETSSLMNGGRMSAG